MSVDRLCSAQICAGACTTAVIGCPRNPHCSSPCAENTGFLFVLLSFGNTVLLLSMFGTVGRVGGKE